MIIIIFKFHLIQIPIYNDDTVIHLANIRQFIIGLSV